MNRKTIYAAGIAIGIAWVGTAAADITLFQGDRFSGSSLTVQAATPNFSNRRFDNRARSAIIGSGRWEVCAEANFRGDCRTLEPGRYSNLGALNGRVSSLRPVSNRYSADCDRGRKKHGDREYYQDDDRDDRNSREDRDDRDNRNNRDDRSKYRDDCDRDSRGEARATLYEGKGFSGHSFDVQNGMVVNLTGSGLNDAASSLRVDNGYWVFCSGAGFSGECRTFGPGDYDALPTGFNNRITSGRRISNVYPYDQSPNWND